jgi:phage terminase large subunit
VGEVIAALDALPHGTRQITIPYKPRDAFKAFHERQERWAVLVCHRRAGKTVGAVNDLIRSVFTCTLPRPRAWYLAPTYGQAKRASWDYAKHYSSAIPGVRFNETELRVDYPGGGRLQLLGAEAAEQLRGIYADAVVLDEFAYMASSVWTQVMRPALSDRQGRATFISSVNGRNEFWKLYSDAQDDPEWYSMDLKADASGILPEKELAALRKQMSDEDYRQEYLNDWDVATKGSYYGALIAQAEIEGRVCGVPYDGALPVHTSWDLGISDKTAVWCIQEVGRELHLIDYLEDTGRPLSHYAAMLKNKGYAWGTHYLPHDGAARELGTGRSRQEVLANLGFTCRIAPRLDVEDGINAVRTLFSRLWVDRTRAREGLDHLRLYRATYDEKRKILSQRPLHDEHSHAADALRTFAIAHRSSTARSARRDRREMAWIV